MAGTSRIQVLLTSDDGERFEEYCKVKGFKKSTLIARLVREHLDNEAFFFQPGLPMGGKQ